MKEEKDSSALIEGAPLVGEERPGPSVPWPASKPAGLPGAIPTGEKDGNPSSASVLAPEGRGLPI